MKLPKATTVRVGSSELVVPPEAGMDFSEYALRSWAIQGAQFTVKNAMGEMRIDGGIRRVLQLLDNERQRHNIIDRFGLR